MLKTKVTETGFVDPLVCPYHVIIPKSVIYLKTPGVFFIPVLVNVVLFNHEILTIFCVFIIKKGVLYNYK